jgi:membrane fusion protein, adhesin transport system
MSRDGNSGINIFLKRAQLFLTPLLQSIGTVLWRIFKSLIKFISWVMRQIWSILRYIMQLADTLITWFIPKAKLTFANALEWYEKSPEMQQWHQAKADFFVRLEKRIIRLFHLEHLELDKAGLSHIKLGQPHKMSFVLLNTIAIFFIILFVWSAIADVDDIAHSEGRVIPSAKMQVIQNMEGGIIQSINVRTGDKVTAGELLVSLSPTQFGSDFDSREQQRMGLMAKVTRLQAELHDEKPIFSRELQEKNPELVLLEQNEFENRLQRLKADLAVFENQYKNAIAELEIMTRLVERGLEPKLELIRNQARVAEALSKIESLKRQFKSDASAELAKANQELSPLLKALPAIEDKLDRTALRSPVNGVVNRVLVTTAGGYVKPGEPIVEIVPSDETLVVEARILPKDIGFVKLGQTAKVKITAYDYSIFGSMNGIITTISADAVSSEERGQAQYYYIARVETDSSLTNSLGKKLPIIPGMQAQVDIITGHKTVLRYLLKPLIGVKENAFRER